MKHSSKLVLVTGGSGSGKSAFAEDYLCQKATGEKHYFATMKIFGEEGETRVERHRKMRQGKGFTSHETPELFPKNISGAVLVEDLTNFFLNHWYGPSGNATSLRICHELDSLTESCQLVVIVANQITSDGERHSPEIEAFLQGLGALEQRIAQRSEEVYEVVSGIAIPCMEEKGVRKVGNITLLIGGKYQGKRSYAQELAKEQGLNLVDLNLWLEGKESLEEALSELVQRNTIYVCDEVGCGVVPMEKAQRERRELVGRVCTALAEEADLVLRMVCGIPVKVKEGIL